MKLQTRWQKEIALVEGLPELAWTQKVPQRSTMLLSVGALLLVMAIVAGSVLLSLPRGTGGPIVLLALGIVGSLGIPMVLQSNLRDARKHRKHFENRQGHLVGVTYASEPWILGTRRAWDIGVLEVVNGTLTFEGYATHFMLPSASIESAELGRIDRFPQPEIRLIVNWQNELSSGRLNLVFLESNTTAEQRDVAEGIVHAVQSSESETFTDVVWPPIYQDDRLNLCLVERCNTTRSMLWTIVIGLAACGLTLAIIWWLTGRVLPGVMIAVSIPIGSWIRPRIQRLVLEQSLRKNTDPA